MKSATEQARPDGTRLADPRWDELLADVRDGLDANRYRACECAINRIVLSGESGIAWSQKRGAVRVSQRQEPEDDRLLQQYRWLQRKLFKTKPQLTAHAGGLEVIDAQRAAVTERLFDYWRANNGWLETEEDAYRWLFPAGRAFVEPVWEKSPLVRVKRGGWRLLERPEEVEVGGRKRRTFMRREEREDFQGDVGFRLLDPNATFLFPLSARRWPEVERIVSIDLMSHERLEELLGEAVAETELEPWGEESIDYGVFESLRSLTGGEWAVRPAREERMYLLIQSRERPTFKRPEGRLTVAAGGRVLREEGLPYLAEAQEIDPTNARNLTMGVVPWFSERVIGSLQPPAPATILRRKQRQIVELMRLISQNRYQVALNKILVPDGSLEGQAWTDENGQILRYNRSVTQNPPQLIQGQPLVGAMGELEDARRSFDESAGRPQVLRGENPPQVRGAFHFEMLWEEASELLALDVRAREKLHENVGLLALAIWRRRATADQVERIYGKERTSHVLAWMNLDIRADLRIQEGSAMPRNYAATEAKVVELKQYNAFVTPDGKEDVEAFWTMLELGQLNRSVQARHMHRLAAENAFARMLYAGELIEPQAWEDHAIYVDVFREQMARPEFGEATPERQAAILAHLEMRGEMLGRQYASLSAGAGAAVPARVPQTAAAGQQGPGTSAAGAVPPVS